jgi:hypothetical protein
VATRRNDVCSRACGDAVLVVVAPGYPPKRLSNQAVDPRTSAAAAGDHLGEERAVAAICDDHRADAASASATAQLAIATIGRNGG